MQPVKFLNVKAGYDELHNEIDAAYARVMHSGNYILGQETSLFEKEFAEYCGAKHCVGVGSGLDALMLLMKAYGIKAGDEVIVPANTYIATWLAVSNCGATPVPVDPDPYTYNFDINHIRMHITAKTKAILAVHLYGQPADMDRLKEIADEFDLFLFEDAAQAHGARYKNKKVGALGDGAGFSFYPGKNLGGFGDGGAITTNNDEIAMRLRLLGNYGAKVKYHHEIQGYNSRLDELQAAMLRIKLTKLDDWNEKRRMFADRYMQGLSDLPIQLPVKIDDVESVWHLFVVQVENREKIRDYLNDQHIETHVHYPVAPHLQPAYAEFSETLNLPISETLHRKVLSLPIGPHLNMTEVDRVIDALRQYYSENKVGV